MYPFDSQTCYIELELGEADQKLVTLQAGQLDMWANRELLQYTVLQWDLTPHHHTPSNAVRVKLVFGRKIVNQVLTTYLPTILILTIVHSTNYFKGSIRNMTVELKTAFP